MIGGRVTMFFGGSLLTMPQVCAIAMPDVRNKHTRNGGIDIGNTPAEFAAQIKAEIVSKSNLVSASGAR